LAFRSRNILRNSASITPPFLGKAD
jgi:hypothetical protein